MRSRKRGFTLIELLVVIAIIAILAAILFPVFARAKQSGQAAACFSNMKQLGLASVAYADENGGAVVPTVRERQDNYLAHYKTWRALLWPHVRSYDAYICPSMKKQAFMWRGHSSVAYEDLVAPVNDVPTTYGINQDVASADSYAQGMFAYKINQYARPTRIILMTEIKGGIWRTGFGLFATAEGVINKQALVQWAPTFHYGKLNVVFMDGHAKTMYLYDTIGTIPSEWMWTDPQVQTTLPAATIRQWQSNIRPAWPKTYPPKGGM